MNHSKIYDQNSISFTNPFKGRQWLKILKPDIALGMTLVPRLNLDDRKTLGFTFKTNEIGFHGKNLPQADHVIIGTSFAMGFGVDEGENWFEMHRELSENYQNLGIPVAPGNHRVALDRFYQGQYKNLIYVYHPNVWKTADSFYKSAKIGQTIFEYLKWKTDRWSLLRLYPRWLVKKLVFQWKGVDLFHTVNGRRYLVNTNYNRYRHQTPEFEQSLDDLRTIFSRFEKVHVYRVPIKEQLLNGQIQSEDLTSLCRNYDECWQRFVSADGFGHQVNFVDLCREGGFQPADYLPNDTHWSPSGNRKFFQTVKRDLNLTE